MYPYRRHASQNSLNRRCSRVSTSADELGLSFVPVALESLVWLCAWLICECCWGIFSLHGLPAVEFEHGIHGGLTIAEDTAATPAFFDCERGESLGAERPHLRVQHIRRGTKTCLRRRHGFLPCPSGQSAA